MGEEIKIFDRKVATIEEKVAHAAGGVVRITENELINLLLGRDSHHAGLGARLPVVIDPKLYGLKDYKIEIVPAEGVNHKNGWLPKKIDLSGLALGDGAPLPPLVLRGCLILGVIDISNSVFASFRIDGCKGMGLMGISCQVRGDLTIRALVPYRGGICRVRLSNARIDGAVDFCKSRLSSRKQPKKEERDRSGFADQFALALNGATIGGRVLLADGFSAIGGVALFQTHIARDVLFENATVFAHNIGEGSEPAGSRKNYAAIDAKQLRCTRLEWKGQTSILHGRIILSDADLAGDLSLQNLTWSAQRGDGHTNGGLDCRRICIGGQLYINSASRIARRIRPTRGLADTHVVGIALDLWKSRIGRGILIEKGASFCGSLQLNQAKIERQISIEAEIEIEDAPRPHNYPYHVALDCRDAVLDGSMMLDLTKVGGRVSLEGMRVGGHVDVQNIQFDLGAQQTPRYDDEESDEAGDGHEWRHDVEGVPTKRRDVWDSRRRRDRSSLLDMQDMTIGDGINLRRGAIGMTPRRYLPPNRFIVDLRGLMAESWDDAEATCWAGLARKKPSLAVRLVDYFFALGKPGKSRSNPGSVPWRIRFDGISFQRLETSSQKRRLQADAIETTGQSKRHWLAQRTYSALSDKEAFALRIAALDSYFNNRNENIGRTRWMRWWSERSWLQWSIPILEWSPIGILKRVYRQTLDSQWQRRERMPQLRPQPYEIFAKAYIARGEVDVAARVLEHKLRLFWQRRMRAFNVRWMKLALILLAIATIGFVINWGNADDFAKYIANWIVAIVAIVSVSPQLTVAVLRYGFGFGLGQKRALAALLFFSVLVGFTTPMIMEGWGFWSSDEITANQHPENVVYEHFFYGLDKMLPVVSSSVDFYDSTRHSGVTITGQHHVHEHEAPDPNFFAWLEMTWELIGWLIFAATAFTLAGFVRRDVER